MNIELWTDGSCKANGTNNAVGGWGYVCVIEGKPILLKADAEQNTTNNRMEMTAMIKGLKDLTTLVKNEFREYDEIIVYTDSAYIQNCYNQKWYVNWMNNGWKTSNKGEVKNQDLWKQLVPFFMNPNIKIEKVKGHNGIELNEKVDTMAQQAAAHLQEELNNECSNS